MSINLTKNGICYDLNKSPYKVKYNNITFYFSSVFYKQKFIDLIAENREKINNSISNRFVINVELNILADLVLYEKVEKRGYLIESDGEKIWDKNIYQLNGIKMSTKNN